MLYLIEVPIKNEFVSDHSEQFEQHTGYIDYTLQQLETYISNWGTSFQDDVIIQYNEVSSNYDHFDEIGERLFHLENTSPLIKSAMLAVKSEDPYYISTGGTWSQTDRNQSYPTIAEMDTERSFQWIHKESKHQPQLYFTQKLLDSDFNESLFLIVSIDLNHVSSLLKISSGVDDGIAAYMMNGELLSSTATWTEELETKLEENEITSTFINYNETNYSLVSVTNERFGHQWTYYSMIPVSQLIQPIQSFSQILLFAAIIFIVSTALFSYFFSKRQYQPIYDFLGEMVGEDMNFSNSSSNAMEYIRNQWTELLEERSILVEHKKDSENKSKRNLITRVIRGEFDYYSEEELLKKLESNGWSNIQKGYRLYSIQLTDFIEEQKELNHSSDLSGFILQNLMGDLADKHFLESATLNVAPHVIYLFVPAVECKDMKVDPFIQDVFENVNAIIKRYVTVCPTIVYQKIKQLPHIYDELSHDRLFHEMKRENQLLLPNGRHSDTKTAAYPTHYEERIINSIKHSDKENLLIHTEQFIYSIQSNSNVQFYLLESIKQLYNGVSHLLINSGILHEQFISKDDLINKIEEHFDLEIIKEILFSQFLDQACHLYAEHAVDSMRSHVVELRDYLHENYADPDLSLEQSAAELNMDPYVLSREFKKYVGMNYIDYITDLRLERAKNLLITTDRQINEIASLVGYNSSYFNRLFKKKFGSTPGNFRSQNIERN